MFLTYLYGVVYDYCHLHSLVIALNFEFVNCITDWSGESGWDPSSIGETTWVNWDPSARGIQVKSLESVF